jgi:hypothetical protein
VATSILGRRFIASVTQLLTYLRRESHLILFPFASALQATIARLRAALSALDGLAASASEDEDITAATLMNSTAMKDVTLAHRDRRCSPGLLLCE